MHKKNQVSNGTNPDAIVVTIGNSDTMVTGGNQHVLSYKEIVTGNQTGNTKNDYKKNNYKDVSVPYSSTTNTVMFSYASVAQGLSSHNKSGPVSMVNTSDKETCDSSGKNVKGNVKSD